MDTSKIISLLGDKSDYYLNHVCKTIDKSLLQSSITHLRGRCVGQFR